MTENNESDSSGLPEKVQFHYIKSTLFRTIHVDGVVGGLAPRGNMAVGIYSERQPIPDMMVHSFSPPGILGPEIVAERISRDGLVREVEVNLVMSIEVARTFVRWLQSHVEAADKIITEGDERNKEEGEG